MVELQSNRCTVGAPARGQAASACQCITLIQAGRNVQLLRRLQPHPVQVTGHHKISMVLPMHAACAAAGTAATAFPSAAEIRMIS